MSKSQAFPLSSSCAENLPQYFHDGFVQPSKAKSYGHVFDPQDERCLLDVMCCRNYESFVVCGPSESIKNFISALDERVSSLWSPDMESSEDPTGVLLALWEPPAQSPRYSMAALIFYGEGDEILDSFESVREDFPDLILVAEDCNDNYPEQIVKDAARGGACSFLEPRGEIESLMAAEAALRYTNEELHEEIQNDTLRDVFDLLHSDDDAFRKKTSQLASVSSKLKV